MIQPIKIIAIFVYRLNEGNPHIPGSLSATLGYHLKSLSIMSNKKVTLQAEELRVVLTAASLGLSIASQDDPEMVEMVKRGQTILHKICEITDGNNKTFDLIAR